MTKTAIIGASGFVGRHLLQAYRRIHSDTIGTSFSQTGDGLQFFDIREPNLTSLGLQEQGFDAVIIASAKPNIAYCEQNEDAAYAVNVRGTLDLIRQTVDLKLKPIFISSDYVFDGTTGGYDDDARTNPATIYGRQKQLVEQEIPRITNDYLVMRLSKIYGLEKGDGTLLDEIASSFVSGRKIRAAYDQIFSPTFVGDLAHAIMNLQSQHATGVFNVCAPRPVSRYWLADSLAQAIRRGNDLIESVALHEIPGMVGRPLNTSMTSSRLSQFGPTQFTPIEEAIRRVAMNWTTE